MNIHLRGSRNGWAPVVNGVKTITGWLPYTEAHVLYKQEKAKANEKN